MIRMSATAWVCFGVIACLSLVTFGDSTTQPDSSNSATTQPQPMADSSSAKPASDNKSAPQAKSPAIAADSKSHSTDGPTDGKFPTPAELLARMKQIHDDKSAQPQVAFIDLDQPITERPGDFSLLGGDAQSVTLRSVIDRLEKARQDKSIRGVLITLDGGGLNISQALEIRNELDSLRRDGKRSFVYADSYDTDSYIAASGATDVCLLQGGDLEIPGVGFETMFAKNLLDKVGVKADYVQIGEYKGADEEYTRAEPSEELKGQLNGLADSLYQQIIDTIAMSRNLSGQDVKALVDDSLIPARVAKDRGLVDHLVSIDEMRDLIDTEIGSKVDLVHDYGAEPREQLDMSSPFALLSMLSKKPEASDRPAVAIVYAEGEIVDGSGGATLTGDSTIGSDDIREAMRMAERDDKVQAIVLRIDSPGGSALASEAMWQSVRRVAKTKPVIISVGSMAASGGYYLASSGDFIFADPTAIVGSIGVVGGKFVLKDLMDKVGLNVADFSRGRNADLFSNTTEWDDRQRRQVTQWMRDTYDMFTQRVMTTREGKIKDIDSVARGRIFSAKQARDLGLVDTIGGLQAAISYAAGRADLRTGEYDVRVLPPPRTIADILANATGADFSGSKNPFAPRIEISPDSLLVTLPPSLRRAIGRELDMMMLLQQRPVVLETPYVMIEK